MARSEARRTWLYRITPSAKHPPFRRLERQIAGAELDAPTPNRLRWDPLALPEQPTDFLDGLLRMAANAPGDKPAGVSIYQYLANRSMGVASTTPTANCCWSRNWAVCACAPNSARCKSNRWRSR